MISSSDLYHVLSSVVPLYVAMALAYASVKWWRIFTPDQCAGINRFVALFAVPLLSFHFISTNNPFSMSLRFLAADTVQKLIVGGVLAAWCKASSANDSMEWAITVFSVATLPNTLVMGIPLLKAMFGDFSAELMVQVVVLQCIIWYTLLLFLFEYRGARILIADQFPATAASIVSFHVDSEVISLDGREPLQADAELAGDGKLRVTLGKSAASFSKSVVSLTPRASNLSNAEIYSVQSTRNPTPRGSSFNHGSAAFDEEIGGSLDGGSGAAGLGVLSPAPARRKDLHMLVWSSSASPVSEGVGQQAKGACDACNELGHDEFSSRNRTTTLIQDCLEQDSTSGANLHPKACLQEPKPPSMPPASVMSRLILIMVWRKLIRNPNTYSSLLGLSWSLVSFRWEIEMPAIIARSISILSDAGLGMAMFSLGLFMALQPKIIACGKTVATFAMAVRFLAGPTIMAVASFTVGLRGVLLHIAIVQAALPQGIVPFVFAKEYNVHPKILSTGVIFGMLIALPITLVYYILLGL